MNFKETSYNSIILNFENNDLKNNEIIYNKIYGNLRNDFIQSNHKDINIKLISKKLSTLGQKLI